MRHALLSLHRWGGLAAGGFLIIIATTGALLVFDRDLDRLLNRRLLTVTTRSQRVPLQRVLENVRSAFPGDVVMRLALPQRPDDSVQALLHSGLVAGVDPYSGEILGIRNPEKSLASLVLALHTTLLVGRTGKLVVASVTVVMLVMTLSGLVLWWPRRILRMRRRRSWRRVNFDLHNVLGFYSAVVLVLIALSGLIISFQEFTYPLILKLDFSPGPSAVRAPEMASPEPLTLDHAVQIADAALPGAAATAVYLPSPGQAGLRVAKKFPEDRRPMGRSSVVIDGYNGQVLHVVNAREAELGSRVINLNRLLHIGEIFGVPSQAVALLVCLALLGQISTGFLIWWKPGKPSPRPACRPASFPD